MKSFRVVFIVSLALVSWSCSEREDAVSPAPEKSKEVRSADEVPAEEAVESIPDVKPESTPRQSGVSKVNPALLDPSLATERAPDHFKVRFDTTKGPFTIEVDRALSPRGADRFYNLVKIGFFEEIALFRVLDGFVAQFGISGDPKISEKWKNANIKDEPVQASNRKGFLTYAHGGKDTRSTQFFINLADNVRLDDMGFPPIGKVVEGMSVVESFYSGYGEGVSQGAIHGQGNDYLKSQFPKLDYIEKATLLG